MIGDSGKFFACSFGEDGSSNWLEFTAVTMDSNGNSKKQKKVSSQGIKTPRKTSQTSSAAKPTSIISCVQYVPNTQLATQDIKLHYFV